MNLISVFIALSIGPLLAHSTTKWMSVGDQGSGEIRKAKEQLLDTQGLRHLHHQIYSKVGAQAWNNQVKPDFMMAITYATIRDTGSLVVDWREVVKWTKSHPEETNRLMQQAGDFSAMSERTHR